MSLLLATSHSPQHNFWVRTDSKSDLAVIREIWCENVYEVQDGDIDDTGVVVDLGANIGAFSVFAAQLRPDKITKVIAVEPEPHNLEMLYKNIKQNNMQEVIEVMPYIVLGHTGGFMGISDEHGGSRVMPTQDATAKAQVISLADLLKKCGVEYVDILKIDVEGAEADIILKASKDTLNLFRYITMEIDRTNSVMGQIVEKLSETHQLKLVGSHETGGMLYGRRY